MSFNKDSKEEDICNFLKEFIKNEKIIKKFREERIKGNELLFLDNEDFLNLGYKFYQKKILPKLNEIKNNQKDILAYVENIDEKSNEEQVNNFLKTEMKFNDEILNNFKNINGDKLKEMNLQQLKDFGLKIGERKKLYDYIQSIKVIDINGKSTTKQICNFLKNKFNLDKEELENIESLGIDGEKFFNLTEDDFEEIDIKNISIKNKILDYIKTKKNNNINIKGESNEDYKNIIDNSDESEEENQITKEKFNHYLLIEINEYLTSQDDINKCPFNRIEDFIQLCEDMKINSEDNCSKIDFDQANEIKLKTLCLWGTKEGLLDFLNKKKMIDTIQYFYKEKMKKEE